MIDNDVGLLLNGHDLKLFRTWFKEMCKLIGFNVKYYEPKENKQYNGYGEFSTYFYNPITTGCIFEEHPNQKTMRKLGWVSELDEDASIIHVDYDLPGIQIGALFELPSGIDGADSRLFRVVKMSTNRIYPSSITCELVPEFTNLQGSKEICNFKESNFNVLREIADE